MVITQIEFEGKNLRKEVEDKSQVLACKGNYPRWVRRCACGRSFGVRKIKAVNHFVEEQPYLVRTELEGPAYETFKTLFIKVSAQMQKIWF